jgi:Fe-S cluster assembly iron-binding protein IscA
MIHVTESAKQELTAYFKGESPRPIRIQLADGASGVSQLLLALDEQCSGDRTETFDSLTFLINERLAKATGDVSIDTADTGFSVHSEKPLCDSCSFHNRGGNKDCG